jgi:putative membrane protein
MFNAIALGIILGMISGLTPGIHTNTFAAFILSYSPLLLNYFSREELAVIIFVNAVVHTFLDIIPSMFLGVPDEDTAIAILPAHELVLDGKGIEAASISAYSSLISFILGVPMFVAFLVLLPQLDLRAITPLLLIFISAFVILSEKGEVFEGSLSAWRKRLYALIAFLASGMLGFFCLDKGDMILLPLLTGLFSAPTLLASMFSEATIPKQNVALELPNVKDVLSGSFAGALVSLFPGISSGVATVLASNHLRDGKRIISAISAANTSNALLCFAVLFSIHKVRSGAVDAFVKIIGTRIDLVVFMLIGILSALAGAILTISSAFAIGRFVSKIKPSKLSATVFIFLVASIYILTKEFGLFVFSIATLIGLATIFLKIRRINCMGSLILPTILIYSL